MAEVIALRKSRRNINSMASIVGALVRKGLAPPFQLVFVDHVKSLPANTRILAYSFCSPELDEVMKEVAGLLVAETRPPWIIAGGPHASADPLGTLNAGFDVAFVGEGEETFPAFASDVLANTADRKSVRTASPQGIDLDAALHATREYGLFPFVEISRGCPHNCAFCQVSNIFGRKMRHRSPSVVKQGVQMVVEAGFRRIRYLTPNAFAYAGGGLKRGVEALVVLLEASKEAGVSQQMLGSFPSEVRPDDVTADLLALVRKWCLNRTLVLGAQSGSDRVLELMHRGHTVEQARQAICYTAEAGFIPHVDVLFCFPGEQPEERVQTMELVRWCLEKFKTRIHAHVYIPLPGASAWPQVPEKLEPVVIDFLKKLQNKNRLDGDWEDQAIFGKKILRWREEGRILI